MSVICIVKTIFLGFFLFWISAVEICVASVRICSWNLKNFGINKSEWALDVIVKTVSDCDILAVQEVNAGPSGSKGVVKLVELLNQHSGFQWDYTISNPTSSLNLQERERYAFIWKKARVKLVSKPKLADKLEREICREPYLAVFKQGEIQFTLANIHALPKKKQPEKELKYLKFMDGLYPGNSFVFVILIVRRQIRYLIH